ncbi:MAG TPA: rRNA maturation RNase YbeY [Candidatus Marinimicrobia bacterium]|nr:rRNA maturation RNase YbeY [Candidatus Neomarinimicrobiota bacterium]
MRKNDLLIRTFDDRKTRFRVYWERLKTAAKMVLRLEGINKAELNLIACSDDKLRQMKSEYFGVDQYTDVIAFPLERNDGYLEGEIYFSPQRILENAGKFGTAYIEELQRVIIHGILHLLGNDDQTPEEKAAMTQLENRYLTKMKISEQ